MVDAMKWIERMLARFGYVPVEQVDEADRELGAALAEADRERNRRAQAEDALVLERSKPRLTDREQAAIASAHLRAARAQVDRLVAAHG